MTKDEALDKKAENARELGLDYEPAEVLGHNGWGFPIKAAAPVQKECDCAAHSAADCVCGAWDKSAVAPVQEDWGPGPHECHSLTASVQEPVAWRYRGILHDFDPSDWAEGPVTPLYTTPPAAVVNQQLTTEPAAPLQEPPPECQTEAEKRAYAFGWWKALEANRAAPVQDQIRAITQEAMQKIYDLEDQVRRKVYNIPSAAPVQEPVGCMRCATPKKCAAWGCSPNTWPSESATPPATQRQSARSAWVGLTDEEILKLIGIHIDDINEIDDWQEEIREVRAIEAKLKEKNT